MLTYDRPELLAEAVECFLRQTVTDSELVIVNDRAEQEIVVDHPRVRVINCDKRFGSTGEKRKYSAEQARGKYLMFWDDDDIHLPKHIEDCLTRLQYFKNKNISRAREYWVDVDNGRGYLPEISRWVHTLLIDRELYFKVGGHLPFVQNEDVAFIHRLLLAGKLSHFDFPFMTPTFIYRKLKSHARICSIESGELLHTERWQYVKDAADKRNVTGRIVIEPRWNKDYESLANAALRKHHGNA